MESLFGWVSQIMTFFGKWIPRLIIVQANQQGIAFVKGKNIRVLEPGLRIYWPLVTQITVRSVVRQTIHLASQTLTTKDRKAITCGGSIVYRINDIKKYIVNTDDAPEAIAETCMAAIRKVVKSKTYDNIMLNVASDSLDETLTSEARRMINEFGAEAIYLRLSDFALARVINITGNLTNNTQYQYLQ